MGQFKFRRTLGRGIALAIPVVIIVYVFIRVIVLFKSVIAPTAQKMGISNIWGGITLTVFAIVILLVFILLLGMLMQIRLVSSMSNQVESIIFRFVPSLNQLKLMAADKLDIDSFQNTWKPVVLFLENKYNAAFVVEEDEELITLFVCKGVSLNEGEIVTTAKSEVKIIPAQYSDLQRCSKAFGKGYLSLIKAGQR